MVAECGDPVLDIEEIAGLERVLLHCGCDEARSQRWGRVLELTLLRGRRILVFQLARIFVLEGGVDATAPDVILGYHRWDRCCELTLTLGERHSVDLPGDWVLSRRVRYLPGLIASCVMGFK